MKGSTHKDRYLPDGVDTEKLTELPDPPQWWDVKVVEFYQKKGGQMIAHNMLTILDVEYLGMYCLLYCKMNKLWQADETPSMSMYTQLNSFAAQMGLNPISREKMIGNKGGKKENKFLKNKKPKPKGA